MYVKHALIVKQHNACMMLSWQKSRGLFSLTSTHTPQVGAAGNTRAIIYKWRLNSKKLSLVHSLSVFRQHRYTPGLYLTPLRIAKTPNMQRYSMLCSLCKHSQDNVSIYQVTVGRFQCNSKKVNVSHYIVVSCCIMQWDTSQKRIE
jgi:hypothetical protein